MPLKPELQHNRKEFDRLLRRKRQVLAAVVLAAFPVAMLVPVAGIPATVVALLTVAGVIFLYLEFRRVQVFRRDLRERRHMSEE